MNTPRVALGLLVASGLIIPLAVQAKEAPPAGATGLCKDGSYTTSATKSGACRGHGGVSKWMAASEEPAAPKATKSTSKSKPATAAPMAAPQAAPMAPAAAPKPRAAAAPSKAAAPAVEDPSSPEGATARCKDGTYSHSQQHSGACSHHGGVGQWLQP
jgi:hypothetical protein